MVVALVVKGTSWLPPKEQVQVRLLAGVLSVASMVKGTSRGPAKAAGSSLPPELLDRVGVRHGALVMGPWIRRAPHSFRFDSCSVRFPSLSRSTTVVRLAVNQTVAGSSPAGTARYENASLQA
jgi:hypothetical protein